jgi:electron transport complex protein RnfA
VNFQAVPLALFAVFASLSMNLVLQCGLGMRGVVITQGAGKKPPFIKLGILFITVLLLWIFFSYIVFFLPLGFFPYLLLFPLSAAVHFSLEYLVYRFVLQKAVEGESPISFCDALAAAALFITLTVAGGLVEAVILSFGFVLGVLLAFVILGEIRRRSMLEEVPLLLRGTPLSLISMGLLSLIFAAGALLLFRAIGG